MHMQDIFINCFWIWFFFLFELKHEAAKWNKKLLLNSSDPKRFAFFFLSCLANGLRTVQYYKPPLDHSFEKFPKSVSSLIKIK